MAGLELTKLRSRFRKNSRPSGAPLNELQTDTFAAEGAVAAPGVVPVRPSLAMLLASHILHDGELVILILRPSLWFMLLSSLWFMGGTLALMTIADVISIENGRSAHFYIELGSIAMAARLMWAIVQWMGRLYVLTDRRALSLTGVFHVDVFDCPLRKVARTRIIRSVLERLLGVGSIEIIPQDSDYPFGLWLMVDHPDEVNEQLLSEISRAKRTGE